MSVIQTIRNRYAKIAGGIIAVALIFFIIQSGNSTLGNLFSGSSNSVAKVNGTNIDIKDYSARINEYDNLYAALYPERQIDEETRAGLHQQALSELVMEQLMAKDVRKLGITVSETEQNDLTHGAHPNELVIRFLTGVFGVDPSKYDPQFPKQLDKIIKDAATSRNPNQDPDKIRQIAARWEAVKAFAVRSALMQKYSSLAGNSVYVPKFVLDRQMSDQANMASIRYVKVAAASIPDAQATVSDNDIKAFLDKHAARFTVTEDSRSIDYVAFDVKPDAGDTAIARDSLNSLRASLATTTDNEGFVNRNSEEPYNDAFVMKKTFMSPYTDSIFNMPVGGVFGPYFDKGTYKMVKVVAKTTLPDTVKCRHILVTTEQEGHVVLDSVKAKARIDSAIAALNAGQDFAAVAKKYSDDPGSKDSGGKYTFSLESRPGISKEFGDFIFEGKTGESKTVKVSNSKYSGYHYIQILEQKDPVVVAKLAVVSKALNIGDKAVNTASNKAGEFAGTNTTAAAFDAAVKKMNLNKLTADNIKASDFQINGVGAARELIGHIYEAKVGDVLPIARIGNRYIVAKVAAEQTKGPLQLTAANRTMLENQVRNEKKMDMIVAKYKSATSLEAIAQQSGTQIAQADSFNAAGSMLGRGDYAPVVVGYTFNPKFALNTLSPGLKQNGAVYYIIATSRQQNPVPANPMAMMQVRQMAEMQARQTAGNTFMELLNRRGNVTYYAKNIN